jgi:hypothetical protein
VQPHNGFDIEEAHKIVALIEHEQHWKSQKHARYSVAENGNIVRNTYPAVVKPKQEALDFERATGEKSAQRIAQERGYAIMKNAVSWKSLHQELAKVGLRFEKKGSGAIVCVGEVAVKASSIDRAFSMKNLCKKMGEFELGDSLEPEKIEPEPVSAVNLDEWKTYCAERAEASAKAVKNDPVMEIKMRHQSERNAMFTRLTKRGFPYLTLANHYLRKRQALELRNPAKEKRKAKGRSLPRFETWLRLRGLTRQADRWRYRKHLETQPEMPVPPAAARPCEPVLAYLAHLKDIGEETADTSRIDALIALRMRVTGHSRKAVELAVRQCAPRKHEVVESRDWRRYAERTAAYAFGVAGDVELAQCVKLIEQWQKIENPEESRPVEALSYEQRSETLRMR